VAEPYLTDLQALLKSQSRRLAKAGEISGKHFFSGAAAYVDGAIFMSLTPVGLALKLPQEDLKELFAQGAKPLKYFPKAPVKKDYAVLPKKIVKDAGALGGWIRRSAKFARK